MATPPELKSIPIEPFKALATDAKKLLEDALKIINPFIRRTSEALSKNLTIRENVRSVVREVTVTAPSETWTTATLLNGWTDYNTAFFPTAGYRVDDDGYVVLRGVVKGGTATLNTPLFKLPESLWPALEVIFPSVSNEAFGEVRVQVDGDVAIYAGTNNWLVLDGLRFKPATPVSPSGFSGSGWPIVLGHDLPNGVLFPQLIRVVDTATPGNSHAAGAIDWAADGAGNIAIRRVSGLTPGRAYTLTFLLWGN